MTTQNNITEQDWKSMFSIAINQFRNHNDKETLHKLAAYKRELGNQVPVDDKLVGARNAVELTCYIKEEFGLFVILSRNNESIFIEFIFVSKENRRKNLGSRMMMSVITHHWRLYKIQNVALRSYASSIPFWESFGAEHFKNDPSYRVVHSNNKITYLMTIDYTFAEDSPEVQPPQVQACPM